MSFTKRRVLITGATGGIGSQTALKFAAAGWDIVAHYFSSTSAAEQLRLSLAKYDVECHLLKADLSTEKEIMELIKCVSVYRVDSLVNNAGSYVARKHFDKLTAGEIMAAFMINAVAPILLSSRLFRGMKRRGFGRILNISSIAAKYGGSAESLHYGCGKLALEGVTKTLAREGAPHNILVNTIRPGVIDTEFHKRFPKDMANRIALIPVKRMGQPSDVADMAYYLGSDKNGFITNETITISGGE